MNMQRGSAPVAGSSGLPLAATAILAVIFATAVMLPSILQRTDRLYPFRGVDILGPDAEVYYAARVREVYDGFPSLGNTFYSAPKDQPYLQPPFPEDTIAMTGKALGMDAVAAFFLFKVILSIAVFFAIAGLLLSVTGQPWTAVLATTAVLFGGALLSAPWDLPHFLFPSSSAFDFLRFSRAVNPQWSGTFFFLCLFSLSVWIRTKRRIPLCIGALFAAVLVYSYVYAWSYIFATVGLLTLWYAARREWHRLTDLVIFWAVTGVLSLPYFVHLVTTSGHPWYTESTQRLGLVLRHGPVVFGVWLAVFIGLSFASKRLWPRTWPLLPAAALAGLIALNQHIITGHYIVPHHYHWYFIQPMASMFAAACALTMAGKFVRGRAAVVSGSLLVLAAITCAGIQQRGAYLQVRDLWGSLQLAAPVLEYVRDNLHAGQVVYSEDVHILNEVAVMTSADVYYSTNANLALTPTERTRFIYFFGLWLEDLSPDQAAIEFPTTRRWSLGSRLHDIYYREAAGDYNRMPDSDVEKNIALYRAFVQLPLKDKLSRYPLTAVITTPHDEKNTVWSAFLSCSSEVFRENGYAVRMMIPPADAGSCL